MLNAFKMADEVLLQGVQGITDLITTPGLINTDFADVKMILTNAGSALMGVGYASGDGRAVAAARAAISSPLLEASIEGARGILLNVSGPSDLGLFELNEAAEIIGQAAHPDANIIFGAVIDDALGDEVRITVIAAGFDRFEGEQRGAAPLPQRVDARSRRRGLARGRRRARPRRRRLRRPRVPALSDRPGAPGGAARPAWRSGAATAAAACPRRRTTPRNVGDHVGDDPAPSPRNRRAGRGGGRAGRARRGGCGSTRCTATTVARRDRADGAIRPRPTPPSRQRRGLPLAVVTADCAPIALACDDAVGVVHAGHRGLDHGVIDAAVARAARDRHAVRSRAFLGPCIRSGALRVRRGRPRTRRRAVRCRQSRAAHRDGRPALDISGRGAHRARRGAGSTTLDDCGVCTADVADHFSYRRDGTTGRQATIVVLA